MKSQVINSIQPCPKLPQVRFRTIKIRCWKSTPSFRRPSLGRRDKLFTSCLFSAAIRFRFCQQLQYQLLTSKKIAGPDKIILDAIKIKIKSMSIVGVVVGLERIMLAAKDKGMASV